MGSAALENNDKISVSLCVSEPPMLKSKAKCYFLTFFFFPTLKCPSESVEQVLSRVAKARLRRGTTCLALDRFWATIIFALGLERKFPSPIFF